MRCRLTVWIVGWLVIVGAGTYVQATGPQQPSSRAPTVSVSSQRALLDEYCVTCHNEGLQARGTVPFAFEGLALADVGADAEVWEKVVRKLRGGTMPPHGRPRPDQATHDRFVTWLETELDRAVAASPNPGRPAIRRLTGAEYINAVRDLLDLAIDEGTLLFPSDDVDEEGFATNGDILSVSPALFERYLVAANRISRLAVGDPAIGPGFAPAMYTTPRFLHQDDRMSEDLPFGSRGGMAIHQNFPLDGEYEVKIHLQRMIYDYILGMGKPQQLDVRLDGALVKRFTVGDADQKGYPSAYTFFGTIRGDPDWEDYLSIGADANLVVRFPAKAGKHVVGVTFANVPSEPTGILERPLSGFSLSGEGFYYGNAAVGRVDISGPYNATGVGDTPSQRRIFTCRPTSGADEEPCAKQILSALARRAYRRPVTEDDIETLLTFYRSNRNEHGFEGGIQKALQRLLVAPEFLFRIERDPADVAAGTAYRLSDLELATRLSLFLWSSIPDDELLAVAEEGRLHDPAALERQVRRMLADARSTALVDNFASQWLQLDRVRGVMPDLEVFFDFDENLRADMERETKLFLEHQIREDRSLMELLSANYTFVNERLARHYGIPDVYGERFRRVTFGTGGRQGGLLEHASLLTITAYPTRTSPVLRGKWLLDNIVGMSVPPPPPDVPDLPENSGADPVQSIREQMEEHRSNPVCAACHRMMDPPGFALENFDAIGRWRATSEAGTPIDASSTLFDGSAVDGSASLRDALLHREESVLRTITEKLLTYALGRRIEYYDQPAVREIVAAAAHDDHRWSSVILELVKSMPFQMRRSES